MGLRASDRTRRVAKGSTIGYIRCNRFAKIRAFERTPNIPPMIREYVGTNVRVINALRTQSCL